MNPVVAGESEQKAREDIGFFLHLKSRYLFGQIQVFRDSKLSPPPAIQIMKDYFNLSWKSPCRAIRKKAKALNVKYAGLFFHRVASIQLNQIKAFSHKFQGTAQEDKQLRTLVKHRENLSALLEITESCPIDVSVKAIQERVDALSQSNSPLVVYVEKEDYLYTSFSFALPLNCEFHTILFEACLSPEGYFFNVYDRASSKQKEFSGKIKCINEVNEKRYRRTRFRIKTTKERLVNREFLTRLLAMRYELGLYGYFAPTTDHLYALIKDHFQVNGLVPIKLDDCESEIYEKIDKRDTIEKRLGKLCEKVKKSEEDCLEIRNLAVLKLRYQNDIEKMSRSLVEWHSSYQSSQSYGTCSASSFTGVEKQMADDQLKRKIKLALINALAFELARAKFDSEALEEDRKLMLEHSQLRIEKLKKSLCGS